MAFYDDDHPARLRVQDLLQVYAYQNTKLRWEFVDPVREVARARHYQINEQGTLVVESGNRLARLDGLVDLGPSEEQLTNALIRVTRRQAPRVCVVLIRTQKLTQRKLQQARRAFVLCFTPSV